MLLLCLPASDHSHHSQSDWSLQPEYASSYVRDVVTQPMQWGQTKFGNVFGSEMVDELMKKMEKVSLSCNAKPFHLFLNRDGYQVTELHSDNGSTLLIMMKGFKRVFIGPFCTHDQYSFIDKIGRTWTWDDNRIKFHLNKNGGVMKTIPDYENDLNEAGIFRRICIGPGDAIMIPKGYIHAVVTTPHSLMLSLTMK